MATRQLLSLGKKAVIIIGQKGRDARIIDLRGGGGVWKFVGTDSTHITFFSADLACFRRLPLMDS